jgi:hypothetical protein
MPRKANSDLGTCLCYGKGCDAVVPVRRQGGAGPLYLFCNNKETCNGTKHFNQNYILDNADMNSKEPLEAGEEVVKIVQQVEKVGPAKVEPVKVVRKKAGAKVEEKKPAQKQERTAKPAGVNDTAAGSGWFDTLIG